MAEHGIFEERQYLRFDLFEGDRDVDIKCRTVKLVKVRKEHACFDGQCPGNEPHTIKIGDTARYEHALVEGAWGSYYMCLPCMDKWLIACGAEPVAS